MEKIDIEKFYATVYSGKNAELSASEFLPEKASVEIAEKVNEIIETLNRYNLK
jgi:hypothetical protein